VDFTSGGFDPAFPANVNVLRYRIEADTKFKVKVMACDNAAGANQITVNVAGGGSGTTNHLTSAGAKVFVEGNKRVWSKEHHYTRAGDFDELTIDVDDGNGNIRSARLRIDVVSHSTDFRLIGSDGVQKR
jgi:hypothetical protein